MTVELFAPQLVRTGAPLCTLCSGKTMNGLNCTCACERMWLYRASQGTINVSVCHIRDLTDDCVGGTNLRQMEAISAHYGITKGQVYQPATTSMILGLVETRRYGTHWTGSYTPLLILAIKSDMDDPVKGFLIVISSYINTPRLHMSALLLYGCCCHSSGAT